MAARGAASKEKDPQKKTELLTSAAAAAKVWQAERIKLYHKILSNYPDSPAVFEAGYTLLRNHDNTVTPEEARAWCTTLTKAARPYGPRLEAHTAAKLGGLLLTEEGLQDIALEQARKAESFLTGQEPAETQVRVLKILRKALQKADKTAEAEGPHGAPPCQARSPY